MASAATDAVHSEPVWRHRADFIIGADIDTADATVRTEQLWARRLGDRRFEICCIPFFLYDLALGDVVETDAAYTVERVVYDGGHYTFRVAFGKLTAVRAEIVDSLVHLGALTEWSSRSMVAVDADTAELAQAVADLLQAHEDAGRLIYETGRTRGGR